MKRLFAPKKTTRSNGGKKLNILAIELAACIILTAVLAGTVIGRYRRQFNSYGSVRALNFYFTSDFLDGGTHPIAPGTKDFTFNLSNHADDLRYSEMDITYTVEVTKADGSEAAGVKVEINGTSGKDGKMSTGSTVNDTVRISNLEPGDYIITVTATGKKSDADSSVSGYNKTLKATIQIPAEDAKLFQNIVNTSEYLQLTVWNEGDREGIVSIEYTGIPDNTNPNMTAADWARSDDTGSKTKENITIEPYSSKVFRFFGDNASATAKCNGAAVTAGTPK